MKAIVLLSGGLDSSVMLAIALKDYKECICLTFDYGQRHSIELESAKKIAAHYNCEQILIKVDTATFAGTALVSKKEVAKGRTLEEIKSQGIPSTYVPARNTIFLSYAMGQAELRGANAVFFGPNAHDHSPYIDCRPEYIEVMQSLYNIASVKPIKLETPLLYKTKPEVVKLGKDLNVPIDLTWSCYDPQESTPCLKCDACVVRNQLL